MLLLCHCGWLHLGLHKVLILIWHINSFFLRGFCIRALAFTGRGGGERDTLKGKVINHRPMGKAIQQPFLPESWAVHTCPRCDFQALGLRLRLWLAVLESSDVNAIPFAAP